MSSRGNRCPGENIYLEKFEFDGRERYKIIADVVSKFEKSILKVCRVSN